MAPSGSYEYWLSLIAAAGCGVAAGWIAATARLQAQAEELAAWNGRVDDEGEEDEDEEDYGEPLKMILVVRQDLKMGKGKIAAQCCHAAVGAVQQLYTSEEGLSALRRWEYHGETKVAVRAETEVQLLEVEQRCIEQGINCFLVVDAGRTQIAPNTRTVLAVGPGPISAIDSVTGDLKLL